jgi:hypothetical protein
VAGRPAPDDSSAAGQLCLPSGRCFFGAAGGVPQFILKVARRCNLACDHCYVYEHADQSWRYQPQAMAPLSDLQPANRIGEHARAPGVPEERVIPHGGESLLAGRTHLVRRRPGPTACGVGPVIWFLGTLLSEPVCAVAAHLRQHRGQQRLLSLARDAKERGWWEKYADASNVRCPHFRS